jgi:hypothetical protein
VQHCHAAPGLPETDPWGIHLDMNITIDDHQLERLHRLKNSLSAMAILTITENPETVDDGLPEITREELGDVWALHAEYLEDTIDDIGTNYRYDR